jgi:hypothetical protein
VISFVQHAVNAVSAGEVGSTYCLSHRTMHGAYNSTITINGAFYVCTVKGVEADLILATAKLHGLFRVQTQASLIFRTSCMDVTPIACLLVRVSISVVRNCSALVVDK